MQIKKHVAGLVAALALFVSSAYLPAHSGMLLEFYELASENDLTLQAARYQRDADREVRPQALAALLPQLSGQANILENHRRVISLNQDSGQFNTRASESYRSKTYGVTLQQALFDWSAFKTLAAANSAVAQAEATFRSAEQNLLLRLASAYLQVLSAEDTLRADTDAQAAFKLQYDQQSGRYKAGLSAVADVNNAKAAQDSSSATIINDITALNAAKRALATIVGTSVPAVIALRSEITLAPPVPASAADWSASAAQNNLDVMAARYAAETASKQVSAAYGRRYPTLAAVGSLQRDDSDSRFGAETQTNYVGLNVNWDLYLGGQVSSVGRQAESTSARTEAQYQLQLRTVDQAVRDHYDGVVNGIAAVRAASDAVTSQEASVVATEVGFKVGTRTIIDTLTTRQNLVAAQKQRAQARYNYLLSLLQLKNDVGQLSVADIRDLDGLLVTTSAEPIAP